MNEQTRPNEVNISDLLRLALPLETAVIAGANQARRTVQWAVMLTSWQELAEQAQTGDLVIVPAALQSQISEKQLIGHLASLSSLAVAGVLLFQPVTAPVEQQADQLAIPLLIAPVNTPVRELHRTIAGLLLNRQTATSERGMQLYRKLSEMSREGQGLTAMTDVICKLTGKIVVVQDKRLDIQAMSVPREAKLDTQVLTDLLTRREGLPDVLLNRKAAARARQSYWQQLLPIENMGRLISPIVSGDRARGYLSVVGPADQLDPLDTLVVEHGAAAIALEMAKAKAVSEAKKALRGDFLEGLLSNTLPLKEIERLEGRLDHDTKQPHAIMTFAWAAAAQVPSLRRLETTINWLLSNHNRPALAHIYGDKHICVFQALKNEADMETAYELARRLQEEAERESPQARLIGGISGPALTLADWPRVYEEAVQAMQLGHRLKLNRLVEFNSLGIYRLLGQLENIPAVQNFTKQVLGALIAYDVEHNSSLVQTLDAYFIHHGNISQTAEALYIHRNTLLYRLERIQELTKYDLNQANMRLAMQLALKLWQLRPEK